MAAGGEMRARGDLVELQATLGVRFADAALLDQALTHASLRHEQQTATTASAGAGEPIADNERMEFLGDAIVGLAVAEQVYHRYPELDEGSLTRLRAAMVSRKHLGHVGTALGLGAYLRLGKAEERSGGRKKAVLLANCMEAVIAAIYLESGLAAAAGFVERVVVAPYVDGLRDELRAHRAIGDYKSALQELLQGRHAGQLEYTLQSESGPDHRKRFLVEAHIRPANAPEIRAQGEASTKKKAEQEAARKVYQRLTQRLADPGTAAGSRSAGASAASALAQQSSPGVEATQQPVLSPRREAAVPRAAKGDSAPAHVRPRPRAAVAGAAAEAWRP